MTRARTGTCDSGACRSGANIPALPAARSQAITRCKASGADGRGVFGAARFGGDGGGALPQAQALIAAPDATTVKGKRHRAILAVLLGCALRRSELASLTCEQIQQRDCRWVVADLIGKGGRVRTVPVPAWVKLALDAWLEAAG